MSVLAPIAMGIAGLGTAMSAFGQYQSSQTNANVADYNAAVMRQNAAATVEKAGITADTARKVGGYQMSKATALYGKSGVAVGEGTPLMVLEETARQTELEAQRDIYSGNISAAQQLSEADLQQMQAKQLRKMAPWMAATTLLSGAGKIATAYGAGKFQTASTPWDVGPGYAYTPGYGTSLSGET